MVFFVTTWDGKQREENTLEWAVNACIKKREGERKTCNTKEIEHSGKFFEVQGGQAEMSGLKLGLGKRGWVW